MAARPIDLIDRIDVSQDVMHDAKLRITELEVALAALREAVLLNTIPTPSLAHAVERAERVLLAR